MCEAALFLMDAALAEVNADPLGDLGLTLLDMDPAFWNGRGAGQFRLGRVADACASFERGAMLCNDCPTQADPVEWGGAMCGLAVCAQRQMRWWDALHAYVTAMALAPSLESVGDLWMHLSQCVAMLGNVALATACHMHGVGLSGSGDKKNNR